MSMLKKIAAGIRQASPEAQASEPPRATAKAVESFERSPANSEETHEKFVQLPRRLPLPAEVLRLNWGGLIPSYVTHSEGIYEQAGSKFAPVYFIVGLRPMPPWHNPSLRIKSDPTPNDCPHCCYECGRRLFYRTAEGQEFCFTCKPLGVEKAVPDKFADESGDESPTLYNVTFFLKKGLGYDW